MALETKKQTEVSHNRLIKKFMIIESSGLSLFSREFEPNDLDDVLFSGFSAAIIAFAREMGKELQSLTLNDETFYFKTKESFIFILSTVSEFSQNKAYKLLDRIIGAVDWKQMGTYLNKEVYFLTNEFIEKVNGILVKYR